MIPAQQCFDTGDLARQERHLRLVIQRELPPVAGQAHVIYELVPTLRGIVELRREEAIDAAAIFLRVIHRGIGGTDERSGIPAIRRVKAYTDAAADMKRMLLDLKRRRQALQYLLQIGRANV